MSHPIQNIASAVTKILGTDITNDEGLRDTPERIYRMWKEFNVPFDPHTVMKTFPSPSEDLVIQNKIPFYGLCEHHFLPFFGHATIGYVPGGNVIGLSKLTRVVKGLGMRRPNIQETLTSEIADSLWNGILLCKGVIVVVSAEHTCMTVRGAQAPGVKTVTSAVRGNFVTDSELRAEFFDLTKLHSHT